MNVYDAALYYLGSRARTCREMEQYLMRKGFATEEIAQTIEALQSHRYLDDTAYCMEYFAYAMGKGKGFRRIRRELQEKGVDPDVIGFAWEDYVPEETELERARQQAEKVMAGKPSDEKQLARLGRRLNTLGYGTDVIYKLIGEYRRKRGSDEYEE